MRYLRPETAEVLNVPAFEDGVALADGPVVEGPETFVRRVAAEMINTEAGAVIVDRALRPLPAPHKPWPMFVAEPTSAVREAVPVHFAPRTCYLFVFPYVELDWLVPKLLAYLEEAGHAHITRSPRLVSTSLAAAVTAPIPAATLAHLRPYHFVKALAAAPINELAPLTPASAVVPGPVAKGATAPAPAPAPAVPAGTEVKYARRVIQYDGLDEAYNLSAISVGAPFTWVFSRTHVIPANLGIVHRVASLLVDPYRSAEVEALPVTNGSREVFSVTRAMMRSQRLPPALAPAGLDAKARPGLDGRYTMLFKRYDNERVSAWPKPDVVRGYPFGPQKAPWPAVKYDFVAGRLEYVGLAVGAGFRLPLDILKEKHTKWEWDADQVFALGERDAAGDVIPGTERYQCLHCDAPASGLVALVGGPRAREPAACVKDTRLNPDPPSATANTALFAPKDPRADLKFIICRHCWPWVNQLCYGHANLQKLWTIIPIPQRVVAARCPGYEFVTVLLNAEAKYSKYYSGAQLKLATGEVVMLASAGNAPLAGPTSEFPWVETPHAMVSSWYWGATIPPGVDDDDDY